MLVRIFKKMGLSEYRITELLEKIARVRTVLSAVFYTVMVFVVIIGISGDVYAGFSRPVPYLIIAIFLFMSFVRMYQCLVDEGYIRKMVEKSLKASSGKKKASAAKSSSEEDTAPEEPSASEDVCDAQSGARDKSAVSGEEETDGEALQQ